MADYKAIGSVSRLLRDLLIEYMEETANVDVTMMPLDLFKEEEGGAKNRLNLYLYHVTENSALKNQSYPGQGQTASLSLVLHYLVTVIPLNPKTDDGELQGQKVLGDAMTVLHDYSILSRSLVSQLEGPGESLKDEIEKIKITLQPLTLDDFSKIWTSLPGANFRRSVAYEVSTVLIQSEGSQRRRRIAPPVETRRLHTVAMQLPEIHSIYRLDPNKQPENSGDQRARVGDTLVIEGNNFRSRNTRVKLGDLDPIKVTPLSSKRIEITLPDDQYPVDTNPPTSVPMPDDHFKNWQPGPQTVQVLTAVASEVVQGGLNSRGEHALETRDLGSNQAVFMLVPSLNETDGIEPIVGADGTPIELKGSRLYFEGLGSVLIIGDAVMDIPVSNVKPATSVKLNLVLKDPQGKDRLQPGRYPVRVMVNGAQSIETGEEFEFTVTS